MKFSYFVTIWVTVLLVCGADVFAAVEKVKTPQTKYEREISAVVRNKIYYKKGSLELGVVGGLLPYDSVVTNRMVGGRVAWHLSDHFAWNFLEIYKFFPSTGSFTNAILGAHSHLNNLQTSQLQMLVATNLMISPFYGKVHIAGRWSVYFDIYLVLGVGMGKAETVQFDGGPPITQTVVRSAWDPALNIGLGFKIFLTRGFALALELRDTLVYTQEYGDKRFSGNYAANASLSLFIPSL